MGYSLAFFPILGHLSETNEITGAGPSRNGKQPGNTFAPCSARRCEIWASIVDHFSDKLDFRTSHPMLRIMGLWNISILGIVDNGPHVMATSRNEMDSLALL